MLGDWLGWQLPFTVGAMGFWVAYLVLRRSGSPAVLRRWGFSLAGLAEGALLSAGAMAAGALFCVGHALIRREAVVNWNLALSMLLYPAWGLIQQFLLVALLADNVMALTRERVSEFVVVMFSALLFSAVHLPDTPLMIATFFLGTATTLIFFRTRNIWVVGVLHGWFATLFYYLVLATDPLASLLAALG